MTINSNPLTSCDKLVIQTSENQNQDGQAKSVAYERNESGNGACSSRKKFTNQVRESFVRNFQRIGSDPLIVHSTFFHSAHYSTL